MDNLTIREALPLFYKEFNLEPDGGVDDASVKIVLSGLTFYIPNLEARKKVVLLHDIHHLVTGYSAFFKGETEISAWELSAGCHNNWVAFLINSYAMMIGMLINPTGVWRAWNRGRNTQTLYFSARSVNDISAQTVNSLRDELGLNGAPPTTSVLSIISFLGMILLGTIILILSIILIPLTGAYSAYVFLVKKKSP